VNFQRGVIYAATLPHIGTEKYFVVVSNNARNRQLSTALAARITTTPKPPSLASIVEIGPDEPVRGRACCDDIELLYPEDCRAALGAFTPATMRRIATGLRAAFALD
jgi:mRNA interferase MazF